MNRTSVSVLLIISLMGHIAVFGVTGQVEMRPGEAAAEKLFDLGIGKPWVGGNPPWYGGQYYTPFRGYSTTGQGAYSGSYQSTVSQYSQYYSMGSTPSTHISSAVKFEIKGKEPASLYFIGQKQAMPYSQYQTYSAYTGGNSLWIQGGTSWAQYAVVPQGASLSLIAISPAGGNGYLYEIRPDGTLFKNFYNFFPYTNMGFYADTVGQHVLLFTIGDQLSNGVVIDVVGSSNTSPYTQTGY